MLDLTLQVLISRIIVLVIAFTIHEFAHAWTADYFGDDTPRRHGRLTLNPKAHLDPMGSLLLLAAGFGWAKPVMVNPNTLQKRASYAPMLVSLAGPLSNFLLAISASIPFRTGLIQRYYTGGKVLPTLPQFLMEFIVINLVLAIFNLIPLYPLDGEKILEFFLPSSWTYRLEKIKPYGAVILISAFFLGPAIGLDFAGWVLGTPVRALFNLLVG